MLEKPIEDISEADLNGLVENQVGERRNLEFKRDLPENGADATKEFLADVSSFANAQGGDVIFGVEEANGVAIAVPGVELDDVDATILTLENRLRDGIAPRLTGVRMQPVPLENGRYALVIRVPSGMAAPHQVSFRSSGKFYNRNSAGKFQMDVHDLRLAFTDAGGLSARFHRLHAEAIERSRGHEMPLAVLEDPAAVVSVFPLTLFREQRRLAITRDHAVVPVQPNGYSAIDMIEGVTMHTPLAEGSLRVRSFATTYREGRADIVFTIGGRREIDGQQRRLVFPGRFEDGVAEAANAARMVLGHYGIDGPWIVMVSVIAIQGHHIVMESGMATSVAYRNDVLLGSLQLDEISQEALRPIGDNFWLLFGERR